MTEYEFTSKAPITGFALFALCHHFGLRGRAMVRSLADQSDCGVPVRLHVFYNRAEDADLLLEGTAAGSNKCNLTLVHVPADRILQRAIHFSTVQEMHDLSHTVFCDIDLWFPPQFWAEYVKALQAQPRGYWSCRVMNVPLPDSEKHVLNWKEISEEALIGCTRGRRHDFLTGHAGTFQCIPRDLAQYPADPRVGVEGVDLSFAGLAIQRSESKGVERRLGRACAYHLDHPFSWQGTGGVQL